MHKRIVVLFCAVLFAFSGIIARIFQLTEQGYAEVAEAQSTVTVTVATARGTLYDRNLKKLTNADTHYVASVLGVPSALSALSGTVTAWDDLAGRLENGKPTVLKSAASFPLAEGILQFSIPTRYDTNGVASHVIGYVDESGVGVSGAEQALNDVLEQHSGKLTVTYRTDGAGRVLPGEDVVVDDTLHQATAGAALTIDYALQNAVQTIAGSQISRGAVVVMEVASGDVLALASFPSYKASQLADYLDEEGSPLFNRATATYNCGSVFKTVTAMAALESSVPITQSFPCLGVLQVGSNRIKCHHVLGHGILSLYDGFAQSCNPYFIQLAHLTGGTALYRYASLLGFDSPLLLMEGWQTARATLPQESEFAGSVLLANVSIGQGDLLATPLHIAAMTACVAGDGVYRRPNLYHGAVDVFGNLTEAERDPASRICSPTTAATLREMMCAVVTDGTGKSAAPAVGTAGGKTGTAETGWSTQNGDTTMVHSWFTGFYPAEDPQYVITVLAEDSKTTGENTAPVFKRLCDQLYRMGYVTRP